MPKKATLAERFWEKVDQRGDDECWEWTGARRITGYGVLSVPGDNRRQLYAHRVSVLLSSGDLHDDALVCHHCDNPSCVNPRHLYIGDHKSNSDDMMRRGRGRGQFGPGENAAWRRTGGHGCNALVPAGAR